MTQRTQLESYQRREAFTRAYEKEVQHKITSDQAKTIKTLLRWSANHCSLCEILCNDSTQQEWATDRLKKVEQYILRAAAALHLGIHFDGDPRGYTVKVIFPKTKQWNTWGGEETGYGI